MRHAKHRVRRPRTRAFVASAALLLAGGWMVVSAGNALADTTVNFTGPGCSDYTVPSGDVQVSIVAVGQAGSAGTQLTDATPGGAGGAGDEASGTLGVKPGDVLDVCVAYDGGSGGVGELGGEDPGGTGGGASGVLFTDAAEYGGYPYLLAGGGGGGSSGGTEDAAGYAGGSAGQDGVSSPGDSDGGLGGGQTGNDTPPVLPTFIQPGGAGANNPDVENPQFGTVSAYEQNGGGGGGGYVAGLGGSLGTVGAGGGGGGESSCGLGLDSDCQITPRIGTSTTIGTGANQPHVSLDLSTEVSSGGFSISSPTPGEVVYQDAPVTETFSCPSGNYACADQNGLPSGSPLDTSTLGSHTLTVSCFPTTQCTGYASVTYTVVAATGTPTVSIQQYYLQGSGQTEQFSCADPDGPGIKSCLDSNGNPPGTPLDTSTVSDGTITVTATSYDGRTTTVSAAYHVIGIDITTPTDGSTVKVALGTTVNNNFTCSGTGVAICEMTNVDGISQHQKSGDPVPCNLGPNTAVVSAVSASDHILVSRVVTYTCAYTPTVSVTTPTDGAYYQYFTTYVQASFTCSEGDGGPGIATCTDQYGNPGSGPNATDLSNQLPGTYTMTVTATSKDGLSATQSVTYHVVAPPGVTFTAPANAGDDPYPYVVAGFYAQGQQVTAEFTCQDSPGGPGIKAGTCLDQNGNPSGVSTVDTSATGHHEFQVCSTSLDGLSGCQSAEYYVVPAATINWPQQGPYQLLDTPVTLDAVPADGSTNYKETYSVVSGPCSLSNNDQLSFTGAGSCVIGVELYEFDQFGDVVSAGYAQQTIAGPLLASASASQASADVGQELSFTGSATGGTGPYTYSWDFGDSQTSDAQNPTHSFSAPRSYTVTLTVTDANGDKATTTLTETVSSTPTSVVIEAFRLVGPDGPQDEFVQLYNSSGSAVSLAGWQLASWGGPQVTIGAGVSIPAHGSYLLAGTAYSLLAGGDATLPASSPSAGGLRLLDGNGVAVDAVGFTAAPAMYRFGSGLPKPPLLPGGQYDWQRKWVAGVPVNTGNNAADFMFLATQDDDAAHGSPILGTPTPSDLASAVVANGFLQSTVYDQAVGAATAPNRVVTSGDPRTLIVNRTITNCSGDPKLAACAHAAAGTTASTISTLVFQITDLTTVDSPGAGAKQAVLKADSSTGETGTPGANSCNGSAAVQALPLDLPAVSGAGGLGSTWTVPASELPPGGLASGQCINVEFQFDIVQGGAFSFGYNTEALP